MILQPPASERENGDLTSSTPSLSPGFRNLQGVAPFPFFLDLSTKGHLYPNKCCPLVLFKVGSFSQLLPLLKPILETPFWNNILSV